MSPHDLPAPELARYIMRLREKVEADRGPLRHRWPTLRKAVADALAQYEGEIITRIGDDLTTRLVRDGVI